jgi:hypothetical protein
MELKIGDKIKIEGYDEAWIGWVTESSYQISKIKSIFDKNGKISKSWLWCNLEISWVKKEDFN